MDGGRDSLSVAVLQMCSQSDVDYNLAQFAELAAQAASRGAQVVVTPENFAFLGPPNGRRALAGPLDDTNKIVNSLIGVARHHRIAVVGGAIPERSHDSARPFQTCVVIDQNGKLVASYRKIHLYDATLSADERYCESDSMTAGSEVVLVDLFGFTVGLAICYDLRFPELFSALAERGAELIVVPAAFTVTTGQAHWRVLLRARAIEAQCYVAASAQWGSHAGGRRTFGGSAIVDPWGEILDERLEGEGAGVATIERARLTHVRACLPLRKHRRLR